MTDPGDTPFELAHHADAPLWLLVFVACRASRRAAASPAVPAPQRRTLSLGCDAVDACVRAGIWSQAPALARAASLQPGVDAYQATLAFGHLAAAARAADAALDFSAAESSCVRSVWRCLREAWKAAGSPAASRADIEALRPLCREARIGRYDAIPDRITSQAPPVPAPGTKEHA